MLAIINENQLVPRPAGTPSYPALSASIYENVNAAVAGSMSPSGAIATAQSQAETALSSAPAGP